MIVIIRFIYIVILCISMYYIRLDCMALQYYITLYHIISIYHSFIQSQMQSAAASGWWNDSLPCAMPADPGGRPLAHDDRIRGAGSCSDVVLNIVVLGLFKHMTTHGWWVVTGTGLDYEFPFSWEIKIIPTDEVIFFRGVGIPPTRWLGVWFYSRTNNPISCINVWIIDLNLMSTSPLW